MNAIAAQGGSDLWTGIDAVLFDLDGVLTPTADLHRQAWSQLFSEFLPLLGSSEPYSAGDYYRHLDGRPRAEGVQAVLASRGIVLPHAGPLDNHGQWTVQGLGQVKDTHFNQLLENEGVDPYPGATELLHELTARGVRVAVVSSSANAHAVLHAAGLADRFELVVDARSAHEANLPGKPEPHTFEHAARELAIKPARCAVLEDSLSGVEAASAGGFGLVVGVDRGAGADALLAKGAHMVVEELTALLPPTGPLATPPDPMDRHRFPVHPWRLTETRFDTGDLGQTETLFSVANGYLGLRATPEEGRPSAAQGTFINGFHETWPIAHAEDAVGFARVGQSMVHVPDAKPIRLYVDDEPLLLSAADMSEYQRSLDFREGVLRRQFIWRTGTGTRVRVQSTRMVSFTDRHLAIMTFEVTLLDSDAPVVISSQTLNRQDGEDEYHMPSAALGEGSDPRRGHRFDSGRVLQPQGHWGNGPRASLTYRCARSRMTLAVGIHHLIRTDCQYTQHIDVGPDWAKHVYRIAGRAGKPIAVTKMVAYHSSTGVPAPELVERCERTLDRAMEAPQEDHVTSQRSWLNRFWARSDVEIPGQNHLRRRPQSQ